MSKWIFHFQGYGDPIEVEALRIDSAMRNIRERGIDLAYCSKVEIVEDPFGQWAIDELLRKLEADGATGLDLSPGDPLCRQAASVIRHLQDALAEKT